MKRSEHDENLSSAILASFRKKNQKIHLPATVGRTVGDFLDF
jgi:hypothetical protein